MGGGWGVEIKHRDGGVELRPRGRVEGISMRGGMYVKYPNAGNSLKDGIKRSFPVN